MSVKAENHHLKVSLWPGLCCLALFPPFFCLLLTISAEVLLRTPSWWNWLFPFSVPLTPLISHVSTYRPALFYSALLYIPKVMIIFIYSWPDFCFDLFPLVSVTFVWFRFELGDQMGVLPTSLTVVPWASHIEPVVSLSQSHLPHLPHRIMNEGPRKEIPESVL